MEISKKNKYINDLKVRVIVISIYDLNSFFICSVYIFKIVK